MSFVGQETSDAASAPVELYRFVLGQQIWRYTSAEVDVVQGGGGATELYAARTIRRGDIQQPREVQKSSLTLTVPRDLPVAQLFIGGALDQVMTLTISRLHRTDQEEQVLAIWKGRVLQASFHGVSAELDCEPVFTSLRRMGLRRTFAPTCPHLLYGMGCGVPASLFRDAATLVSVAGREVVVPGIPARPDGWFTGGELVWQGRARRLIVAHAGPTLTLSAPVPGLAAGALVDVYPGCDHALSTCRDKFDNLERYGGFPFVPTQNPFGGQAII